MKEKNIFIQAILLLIYSAILIFVIRLEGSEEKTASQNEVDMTVKQTEMPQNGTIETVMLNCSHEWKNRLETPYIECNLNHDIQDFTFIICNDYNIDFGFVMAVIAIESDYQADLISDTDDYGLMQINKVNHEWLSEELGITDFLNPYQNIQAGVYELYRLFEKYEDPAMVLMAYNMGEAGARNLWNQGIYETNYSRMVINKAAEYQGVYE